MKLKSNIQKQQAFTLVEVMVAMVIFSVGLLGLAGMQSLGMTSNQTAYLRTVAMQQTYNMSDRMRNNDFSGNPPIGVSAGLYDAIDNTTPGLPAPNCLLAPCTPTQLRNFDHFEWNTNNAALLPQGQGTVTNIGGGQFIICVMWNELNLPLALPTPAGALPDCTGAVPYDPTTQLKFYALQLQI